jgi:hypothetical protein
MKIKKSRRWRAASAWPSGPEWRAWREVSDEGATGNSRGLVSAGRVVRLGLQRFSGGDVRYSGGVSLHLRQYLREKFFFTCVYELVKFIKKSEKIYTYSFLILLPQ